MWHSLTQNVDDVYNNVIIKIEVIFQVESKATMQLTVILTFVTILLEVLQDLQFNIMYWPF